MREGKGWAAEKERRTWRARDCAGVMSSSSSDELELESVVEEEVATRWCGRGRGEGEAETETEEEAEGEGDGEGIEAVDAVGPSCRSRASTKEPRDSTLPVPVSLGRSSDVEAVGGVRGEGRAETRRGAGTLLPPAAVEVGGRTGVGAGVAGAKGVGATSPSPASEGEDEGVASPAALETREERGGKGTQGGGGGEGGADLSIGRGVRG